MNLDFWPVVYTTGYYIGIVQKLIGILTTVIYGDILMSSKGMTNQLDELDIAASVQGDIDHDRWLFRRHGPYRSDLRDRR